MTNGKSTEADIPDISVKFRLVREAEGPREGLALCMPNLHGPAVVGAYAKAKLLPGHDLWACDADIAKGSAWDDHFWPRVARVIAAQIQQGTAPRPTVLIGFSVGGYVAWLVARMLATWPDRPRSLITLDTFPLHYTARSRVPGLLDLLRSLPPLPMPMVDIRRARPGPFANNLLTARGWDAADGQCLTVYVATLDHSDVVQYQVLTQLAPFLQTYVTDGKIQPPEGTIVDARELVGGKVWSMLNSVRQPDLEALRALLADDVDNYRLETTCSLLFLVFVHGSLEEAKLFCDKVWQRKPTTVNLQYARCLLEEFAKRSPGPSGLEAGVLPPAVRIPSPEAYELALQLRDSSFRMSQSLRKTLRRKALQRAVFGAFKDYKGALSKLQSVTLSSLRYAQEKLTSTARSK